nr:reverse transcriptase domain-containing protein [Tanacetum cinerariifolium]
VCSVIIDDGTRGSKSGKEIFQEFSNNSSVVGGERFRFNLFRQVVDSYEIDPSLMLNHWFEVFLHENFVSTNSGSIPFISESFQAIARLCDFKTVMRAVFSSTLKSFAIMTGNLSSPSKNVYLRWGEAITFNLDQTSRYSANYNDMTTNRIDVIDMACKEYSQEVLGFSDVIASGNPTPYYDLIVSTSSSTLTSFGESNVLLEEVDAFLALEDDATSPEINQSYFNPEGDILLLEAFLNDDLLLPTPNQGNNLP